MRNIILIVVVFLLVSCSDEITTDYRNLKNNFSIYLVEQTDEFMSQKGIDLESLQLESTAWVKSSDIEFYDWSAHTFYLNKEVEKGDYSARNFVVSSGDQRLFIGVFWPMYMSSFPMIPSIMPEDDWFIPKDIIRFNSFGWHYPQDLDDDEKFKSELMKANLFREGIDVEIISIERESSTTLQYTFKVTNRDLGKIYILDPDKMGSSRFHYYTNGVSIGQNGNYYWPQDFKTTASDKINSNWYYKLSPGKAMTRTLSMEGYKSLPTGKVNVSFNFPGAYYLKEKEWKKSDGRIWIGDFFAEKEIMIQ